jgi:hypothetical protein
MRADTDSEKGSPIPDLRHLPKCERCGGHQRPDKQIDGGYLVELVSSDGSWNHFARACPNCQFGMVRQQAGVPLYDQFPEATQAQIDTLCRSMYAKNLPRKKGEKWTERTARPEQVTLEEAAQRIPNYQLHPLGDNTLARHRAFWIRTLRIENPKELWPGWDKERGRATKLVVEYLPPKTEPTFDPDSTEDDPGF